ncbi:MAG: hypothetical protein ABGW75_11295, partial [Pirellulales bacterium]
ISLVPHAGNAYLRLTQVLRSQASPQQHGLRCALGAGLGYPCTITIERGHLWSPGKQMCEE